MKKVTFFTLLFCLLIFGESSRFAEAAQDQERAQDTVYVVKIDGEIDLGLAPFIKRIVREAEEKSIEALILEINTFGGRLDAAVQIRDALIKTPIMTIAFINERAISAGALISLSCKKICMAPAATIGAAAPVTINPLDQEMKPASEKVVSYFRKEMKATAEKNNRSALIAEAMVDPDVVIEGLIEKGKLLTMTTQEALEHKVADYEISDEIRGVLETFDLQHFDVEVKKTNWAEKFVRMISGSMISSFLLIIGFIALFMEFKTPTWGVAGTIGVLCLALFFWGHTVLNLVGWEEVILLIIGAVLLALEIFVIPGFGITGILGIIALTVGFILSMVGKYPSAAEIWSAISHISFALIIVMIALAFSIKSMAHSKAAQQFILTSESKSEQTAPEQDTFLNQEGYAYTNLRPAGKGIFNNQRINVMTEGDFIEKGSPIRIIRIEGSKITVQRIKKEKETL
ncbi:MAG: NfeD family protein [bacterium]